MSLLAQIQPGPQSIDWTTVLLAIITAVVTITGPLVALRVAHLSNRMRANTKAVTEGTTAATEAATKAKESAELAADAAKVNTETLGAVHLAVNSNYEKLKAELAESNKKIEDNFNTILELTKDLAEAEAVVKVQPQPPHSPLPGSPALPGTAENPIPIILKAEHVDATSEVINVVKEKKGPQTDGS